MNQQPGQPGERRSLSLDQWAEIDRVCTEFDRDLRAGREPKIEDYLARLPQHARPVALGELLGVELEVRHELGLPGDPEDYCRRFAEYPEVVQAELGRLEAQANRAEPQSTDGLAPTRDTNAQPSGPAPPGSMDDDVEPKQLGRYEIRRFLGGGAYGLIKR